MATVLRSYDWSQVSQSNKRARSRTYPWDDWFDGRIWQLEAKTDFDGPPAGLERVIRTSAHRRGVKVRIRIDSSGNVILQVHKGEMATISKSPSLKSIKAQREGTNGDQKPVKVVKRATKAKKETATPAPRKRRLVKASA